MPFYHADSTIAFPIIAAYVLATQKPRKSKRLYKNLDAYYSKLQQRYLQKLKNQKLEIRRKH
ncbi:MAG TPA: hypothetical protein VNK44_01530 [Candidatus Nitrosotenuis sp.]|nr:hypothetical protein [Candidatus Nitrosotenuis sp.]